MHGPHESRVFRAVPQRPTHFGNQTGEICLEHERGWPELLLQLVSGDRAGSILDEQQQQLKSLRRQTNFGAVAEQLTGA